MNYDFESLDGLVEISLALEEAVEKNGGRIIKKKLGPFSASTSAYYTVYPLSGDEEDDLLQKNESYEMPEAAVRVASHANLSGRSIIDFNIAPGGGADIEDVIAWVQKGREPLKRDFSAQHQAVKAKQRQGLKPF